MVNENFDKYGIGLVHHFAGGVYCKETHIPAGRALLQHAHPFEHLSVLAKGSAVVSVDGVRYVYDAPAFLKIKANAIHEVQAVSDCVWGCIHATNETDPDKIDHVLMGG
jgi:quercetin dioxygenase-like cupin family protein